MKYRVFEHSYGWICISLGKLNTHVTMKTKLLIMAMMIVGAMCSCTAQNGENVEQGCDVFKTESGTTVKMYCIKHGSLRMQMGEKWIYVDPVTTAVKPVTDYSTLPQADYILVTHEHFDHLDSVAINQLTKQGTVLITNARCHEILGCKGEVMANGDSRTLSEGWTVDAVPAYNNSPEKLKFHPKGRDNGFVLTIEGMRIYIAGDTEDIPEMAALKDIDVALLPCNLPYTMTPEQCARAAKMFNPTVLFPYHYGETDIQQVVKLLEGSGIDVRIRDYQ